MSRYLIIGPSWVGDTMMAQSLFMHLRANGITQIDVISPEWTAALLHRMPEVSNVILSPFQHGNWKLIERFGFGQRLRGRYDHAIVLPNTFKSAIIPFAADIPIRTGFLGEFRYGLLNDYRPLDVKRHPLMVMRYLSLGLPKDADTTDYRAPKLRVSEQQQQFVQQEFNVQEITRKILAFCPGAAFGTAKCWPKEHYQYLAQQKVSEGFDIWLFGSNADAELTNAIARVLPEDRVVNWAGRLSLTQTVDLMSLVSGVLCNDSGLMHVAAALQKPIVALYGPTDPSVTPPLSSQVRIATRELPCQPCHARVCPLKHHACMLELTPQLVGGYMQEMGM